MTQAEARVRFTAARVARLATADGAGRPHLVPVVFAAALADVPDGGEAPGGGRTPGGEEAPGGRDRLVMAVDHKPKRTTRLVRLANIAAQPEVSLLVDHYEEDWDLLWWVRADGRAVVLPPAGESPASAARVALLREKYAQHAERPPAGPVVEITVSRWSGWRAR